MKKRCYFSILFLLCIFLPRVSRAVVLNDNCDSAIVIPVGTSCVPVEYSNVGATNSVAPAPGCGGYAGGDVWFTLTVPVSGKLQIKLSAVSAIIPYWAIYTGTCSTLSELKCNQSNTYFNMNDLSRAGQILLIRVWRYNNASGGTFSICAWEPPTPVYDFCSDALLLMPSGSCSMVTYNTTGVTSESVSPAPTPSCGAYVGGDLWFKTVVPASGNLRIEKNNVSGITAQSAVYTGSCGAMSQLFCLSANEDLNISDPLLAGDTLFIRVWDYNNPYGTGTFNLCVWEPATPLNDDCAYAQAIPVNSSCVFTTYLLDGCTAEGLSVASNPGCGAYAGGDAWFTIQVPSSGNLRIQKANIAGGVSAMTALYTGTCGAFTQLVCLGTNQSYNISDPAMAGQTIYLRAWDYGIAYPAAGFSMCAWEPVVPANNLCANAINLSVNTTCVASTYNNIGCTGESSSTAPNPSCGFYQGGDVWFTVTVPASGKLRFSINNISGISAQAAFYTGSCGTMTSVTCIGANSSYNINNMAMAGVLLYVRVYNYNNAYDGGTFSICAWDPSTAANDFCANALALSVGTACMPDTFSSIGCTSEPSSISPNPTCGFYQGGDLWFTLTMPSSGHLRIERGNITGSGMNACFALYTGTCGSMTQLTCSATGFANYHDHSLAGQTIYVRVWNYNDASGGGKFTLCAWDPSTPEYDFCANALMLTVTASCSYSSYSGIGTTSESVSVAPNPTCGFYAGGDLWFKFIMPSSGLVTVKRINGVGMNAQMALYSGTCGSMTQLGCAQSQSTISLNDLSRAGQTIYLRVYDYNSADAGLFSLCVYDPACIITIDSVSTTLASCTTIADGSLTIHATCASCASGMQYSVNGGAWQSSPLFSGLPGGAYVVSARDAATSQCLQTYSNYAIIQSVVQAQTFFQDLDGDTYGNSNVSVTTCSSAPTGYVSVSGDCNDGNIAIHPGATEITCNGIDENCNGAFDDTPTEIRVSGNCNEIADGDLAPSPTDHDATSFGERTLLSSTTRTFTIENTDYSSMTVSSIALSGPDATSFSIGSLSPPSPVGSYQSASFTLTFHPSTAGSKTATVTITSDDCDEGSYEFAVTGTGVGDSFAVLNIKAFIEGYYIGNGLMVPVLSNQGLSLCPTVCDSVEIELRDPLAYSLVASNKILLNIDGTGEASFKNINGSYYLVIRHRNALQTWSASPVSLSSGSPVSYDFSASASQAYDDYQVMVGTGIYALYSGDINRDENIDLLDAGIQDYAVNNFVFGYDASDINGDGNVDLLDIPVVENNINNFIFSHHP